MYRSGDVVGPPRHLRLKQAPCVKTVVLQRRLLFFYFEYSVCKVLLLPEQVLGVLRGCWLGSFGRATIMSATPRSWEFDDVCMTISTSFPGCPPDRWSHGTFCVWRSWMTGSKTKPKITLRTGMMLSLNPRLRLSWDLATWKQTRTAMAQEKANRGLRTPVRQHSNSTAIAQNAPKPDLARLAGRTVLQLSRSWPLQSQLSKVTRPRTRK